MERVSKTKLLELHTILSKMSLEVCCVTIPPEFGVRWREVARAIRNARLPMTAQSISKIVCRGVAKNMTTEEVDDIISRMRLKLVATQSRTWYVINLLEPLGEGYVEPADLPERLVQALNNSRIRKNMTPEVQTTQLSDLVFISVQLSSNTKSSAPMYIATPPGLPVALTSSINAKGLLKPCVLGLGYKNYEDANLYGRDIQSLLRIHAGCSENIDNWNEPPEYAPMPVVSNTGIDYTNREYDEQYVASVLGPKPPHLTDICVKRSKAFFDPSRLYKDMNMTVHLKSEDVAKTLKSLVAKGALAPTSDFFGVFRAKSNKITYTAED